MIFWCIFSLVFCSYEIQNQIIFVEKLPRDARKSDVTKDDDARHEKEEPFVVSYHQKWWWWSKSETTMLSVVPNATPLRDASLSKKGGGGKGGGDISL